MPTVLVLTNSYDDAHVNAVARCVHRAGNRILRVDTDRILRGDNYLVWDYQSDRVLLRTETNSLDLLESDSIWFRKPFGFGGRHGLVELIKEPVQREIVEREVRDIVSGLCTVLNSRRWVNHPNDMSQARLKPYQLKLARSMGFCVPDSIITNDPEEAKLFCQAPTVFKMLAKQSFEYGDKFYSVDTTLMTDELIANLSFIRSQPILLQRCVEKIAELRVTYVGGEVFVAKQTTSVEGAPVDWIPLQGTQDSIYEPWDTSPGFVAQIQSLMKRLNLKFAAIDFAVDSDGVLWFLEVNPNGQWLGYTDEIGMPAAASMARLLAP